METARLASRRSSSPGELPTNPASHNVERREMVIRAKSKPQLGSTVRPRE